MPGLSVPGLWIGGLLILDLLHARNFGCWNFASAAYSLIESVEPAGSVVLSEMRGTFVRKVARAKVMVM